MRLASADAPALPPPLSIGQMNTVAKVSLLSMSAIAGILVVGLAATTIVNVAATASEQAELQDYGERVPVDGKKMNVVVSGSSSQTIVLLPGLGTASPGLDFAPLVDELDDDFRVVVVEPFGYGLSDQTEAERTSANIAGEVHEALQQLHISRYVLAGHSISGIYALEYVSRFRDEVTAFVGIDTSVPGQPGSDETTPLDGIETLKALGLLRLLSSIAPDPYEGLSAYDEAARKQLGILGNRNAMTPTLVDEVERTPQNFAAVEARSFPVDLPLLVFIVANEAEVGGWRELHEEQVAGADRGLLVQVDGGHYLHHTKAAEIAQGIRDFLAE